MKFSSIKSQQLINQSSIWALSRRQAGVPGSHWRSWRWRRVWRWWRCWCRGWRISAAWRKGPDWRSWGGTTGSQGRPGGITMTHRVRQILWWWGSIMNIWSMPQDTVDNVNHFRLLKPPHPQTWSPWSSPQGALDSHFGLWEGVVWKKYLAYPIYPVYVRRHDTYRGGLEGREVVVEEPRTDRGRGWNNILQVWLQRNVPTIHSVVTTTIRCKYLSVFI